jgi:hypothetical protein
VPVRPKLLFTLVPVSVGSGWGSVTSLAVCNEMPV